MREKDLAKLEPTFRQIGGYINYEDYMFLLMMLTTPRRNFEIAFRMFDLDGNGVVDAQEFAQVTETIMRGEKVSERHTCDFKIKIKVQLWEKDIRRRKRCQISQQHSSAKV